MESWIKVNKYVGDGDDIVQITVEPNRSISERIGFVHISDSSLNKTLSIIQKGINEDVMNKVRFVISTDDNSISGVYINSVQNEVSMDVAEVVYTLIRCTYIMDEPNFFLQTTCYDTATQEVYFPKFIEQNTPKKCTVHFSDYLKIVITSQGTITLQAS